MADILPRKRHNISEILILAIFKMVVGWRNKEGQFYPTQHCVASPEKLHCNEFKVSKCLILSSS